MTESPALRALLANLVDYAGLFPPSAVSLPVAKANYERYLHSENAWMLGRFVVPAAQLSQLQDTGSWRITVLSVAAQGDLAVSEIRVDQDEQVFFAASFFEFGTNDTVMRLRELWVTSPYEEPAEWRAPWSRELEV